LLASLHAGNLCFNPFPRIHGVIFANSITW
jgi:hypothetical protein